MRNSTKRNRGVVLLIVLSLLVLFTIMAVTFVIVAASYRDGAAEVSKYRRVGDDPRKLLDASVYSLLRGSLDENSPFRGHELLRDIYGFEGFVGSINVATFRAGNQLIDVTVNSIKDLEGSSLTLNDDSGFYNGRVMTFVSGDAGGVSTRIVAYDGPSQTFRIVAPYVDGATKATISNGDNFVVNGRPFNGTGFGYDSDETTTSASTALLDEVVTIGGMSVPVALLPNLAGHSEDVAYIEGDADESYDAADFQNVALAAVIPTASPNIPSILPSFHRAALINYLFKNQITTYLNAQSVAAGLHLSVFLQPYGPDNILDSSGGSSDDHIADATVKNNIVALKQAMIFRPLPELNPDFDGGNIDFTSSGLTAAIAAGDNPYVIGGWDVDNDGDGYTDGVWINPGFPLQTTKDGRLARPLVSVLVVDMDGKINLNAQGNWSQIVATVGTAGPHPARTKVTTSDIVRTPASDTRPTGDGYGPPEINPTVGTSSSSTDRLFDPAELEKLLLGISTRPGRYSADQVPGASGLDTIAARKFYDIAADFTDNNTANIRSYQTIPDLRGELAVGLDHAGQPRWDTPNSNTSDVRDNNPYQVNLATNGPNGINAAGASDTPFSPSELERVLRHNDVDAELLPDRLAELFSVFTTDSDAPRNRRLVTTDSYDVPVPHVYFPNPALAPSTTSRPEHVSDLLRRRVRFYIDNDATLSTLTATQRATLTDRVISTSSFLSPDIVLGTKMDINRPFGDSKDNNANNVVDEHWQTGINEASGNNESIDGAFVDHDNDGVTNENGFLARHFYARHLYQLMMLLAPTNGIDIDGSGSASRAETVPVLAQWVANVVDFRDPDAIMTPFEYDNHPFSPPEKGPDGKWGVANTDDDGDGTDDNESEALWPGSDDIGPWKVDGYLGVGPSGASDDADTERGLVWGCERPEVLISETLATHARRTEDLASPQGLTTKMQPSGSTREDDAEAANNDALNDFDQRLRPRGSFFVELYNPWASTDERVPRELYRSYTSATGTVWGVDLNKQVSGTPVWRLVVVDVPGGGASPPDPDDDPSTAPANATDVIYMTDAGSGIAGATRHIPTAAIVAKIAPLVGGRYAVVGTSRLERNLVDPATGAVNGITDYVTLIGRRTDADESIPDMKYDSTHRVVLQPNADPEENRVYVEENGTAVLPKPYIDPLPNNYVADTQPPVAIPIPGLNITEGNYPAQDSGMVNFDTSLAGGEGAYQTPFDVPFDTDPFLKNDGTYRYGDGGGFNRIVYLQRLANPLVTYNATTNPYLTIDSMPVDLTSFNGVNNESTINDPDNTPIAAQFHSRERGDAPPTGSPERVFWARDTYVLGPKPNTPNNVATHFFPEQLNHSLGYLNEPYDPPDGGTMNNEPIRFRAYGPMTTADTDLQTPRRRFVGSPNTKSTGGFSQNQPFPWFTWNNRPFVSELEMMLVPKFRSSQLLREFGVIDPSAPAVPDPYAGSTWHYKHMLNFFDNRTGVAGTHFYRVLEYLNVPSRFVGTETWLNKTTFASGTGTDNFHPPFNRIPAFREPGKLNINTIYDDRIWRALTGLTDTTDFATPDEITWSDSRRGYGTSGSGIININDSYPTIFANPLRGSGAGRLVPLTGMVQADIDCTLLRSDTTTPSGASTSGQPNFATTSGGAHLEPNRNPYFRYRSIQRLANLTTCRSNVYAVWVTIGMFEVDPVSGGLGQEIGSETGEVQRHRAFYMIDRSIPVAYEPGENHNVDRAILVRRFVE